MRITPLKAWQILGSHALTHLAMSILGAALLMRVETTFRILGYPGLAMLLFLAAVVGGVLLVLNIVLHDEHSARK